MRRSSSLGPIFLLCHWSVQLLQLPRALMSKLSFESESSFLDLRSITWKGMARNSYKSCACLPHQCSCLHLLAPNTCWHTPLVSFALYWGNLYFFELLLFCILHDSGRNWSPIVCQEACSPGVLFGLLTWNAARIFPWAGYYCFPHTHICKSTFLGWVCSVQNWDLLRS